MRRALVGCCLAAALGLARTSVAKADPKPLSEQRSNRYYYLHSSLIFTGAVATTVEELLTVHHGAGYDLGRFGPDDSVRENFSAASANLSDKLLALNLTMPLFLQMSQGFNISMGNATLIYTEAQILNVLAANTSKILVRRPRPYTHSKDPRVRAFMDRQGADAYSSFYSAHSSTAFTSAMAGSLLYSARTDELVARHTVWGLSFLLAGLTAQLRVRSGRHYRTDIWAGAISGVAVGLLVPALHRVELNRVRGTELLTAGGGFAISMLLSEVIDFCGALDVLHLCGLPRDISVPLQDSGLIRPRFAIAPTTFTGGGGLTLSAEL
jgi:membrane-associated phospholipid phosphatase